MKTQAAILWERGAEWSVEEIDLDPPKAGEVLVELGGSGLCHSDEHVVTGDLPWPLPMIGGHEGAGTVLEVGPGVTNVAAGDQVIFGFIPACGRCSACSAGMQNLCEYGQYLGDGTQISDHTARHHARGQDLGLMCLLGTFAQHTVVSEANCIKIEPGIGLDKACLLGCGVVTGWGSMVLAGNARAGDTVVVVGTGGIGINAVQGGALVGAQHVVAVDPADFKREKSLELGATHAVSTSEEAQELVMELTWGKGANVVVNTMGVGEGDQIAKSLAMTAKRGSVVVTNLHRATEESVSMSALDLVLMEKRVIGSLFGTANPRYHIPKLLSLYASGHLKLDELATRTYKLDDVNTGYTDMREGRNLRGVITF
ncbi:MULTISPECIES: NDMA-dependent alcohol dehydrogenase [Nocardiaceae]|jgi:NDMA-dependent alcohol dehydrogenase|uniref:NDMA-dependent alcohol dehydrogenase n=1 Tax=Nocardiaceae TaxID=85025 RepID=UPI000565C936|nr:MULTISPECIES: NDMA-dependent alcohol dehydrogenase [Rhodococcus]OZE95487.1 NDMA-dependent alcohol dehydrogenase [Rhodococcus sp. 15-1189-1-1a]OZF10118.1 NDMA-dependent alcohol dehydrogenase [Rhodococcus sp. 14-2686-1-2]OZF55544.1 NDMA-dependent alcohol dehydrogenase [Rhodococcus sp. 14-2470-1b]